MKTVYFLDEDAKPQEDFFCWYIRLRQDMFLCPIRPLKLTNKTGDN